MMKEIEYQREDNLDSLKIEEISRSDASGEDFGHGQSYECIFCKRGFSKAQALGGHMNIHRLERAGMKQLSSDLQAKFRPCRSTKNSIIYTEMFPQLCSSNQANCIPPPLKSSGNHHNFYHELIPPISSAKKHRASDLLDLFNSQHLDHCISDDPLSFRLGNLAYDPCHRRFWIEEQGNQQEYGEMDLELRLGQYDTSLV